MIVDTSALVAILYREPEAQAFIERIHEADVCRISVANSVELSMAVESQLGPDGMRQAEAFFRRAGARRRTGHPRARRTGPAGLSRLRQGPPQGRSELRRLFFLCARQGDGRSPPVQGGRFRPDRHQARMSRPPALPEAEQPGGAPLPAKLEPLVETARAYARAATSRNTNRAYAADWRNYLRWRARQGLDLRPLADPECVGLYLAALASGAKGAGGKARTVATIERRLSALVVEFRPEGPALRPQEPPCRDRARRRAAHAWPAARPEGGAAAGACPGDARPHPPVELTEPARPGDPAARLRRRPAPLGNRRPRHEPRGFVSRHGLAGILRRRRAPRPCGARPAGARSRSAAARRTRPARSPRSRPGCNSRASRVGRCSGRWSGARSVPKVSTTATSRA